MAFAEPAAQSTIAHTVPNKQLKTTVCIDLQSAKSSVVK
jgi:hypothetical protein